VATVTGLLSAVLATLRLYWFVIDDLWAGPFFLMVNAPGDATGL
jgi:hypothetical protein